MNSYLVKLINKQNSSRLIIGLMSGTSLDGLDIALCKVEGSGTSTHFKLLEFESISYEKNYLKIIEPIFANKSAPLQDVTIANAMVARIHAKMILKCLNKWKMHSSDIDLIASHGQTIFHAPKSIPSSEVSGLSATLQIGDGDHLAHLTQITTISDFRQKHIAAGGEGAPLVPYSDFLMYNHKNENRMLLNIGGISNYTFIPSGANFKSIQYADIGPGNTLMDQMIVYANIQNPSLANTFGKTRYDKDGRIAEQGKVIPTLVKILTAQLTRETSSYTSTGQEVLNIDFIKQAWQELSYYTEYKTRTSRHPNASERSIDLPVSGQEFYDLIATLNQFTALTICNVVKHITTALNDDSSLHIYVSGGGVHNTVLMANLKSEFTKLNKTVVLEKIDVLGLTADAKEAVMFALLANESVYGNFKEVFAGTNIELSGLGKISLP